MTTPLHRREFLTRSSAAALALGALPLGSVGAAAATTLRRGPKSATEQVVLGQSGVTVSLVGMGTGTVGGNQSSNQTKLGVPGFTRVVRHCLERGINFFDVADQYGSHVFLREALRGVPRDRYVIQTKTHARDEKTAKNHIERYCLELGVDHLDVLLLHCMTNENWPAENAGAMDYLMKAREQGLIRAHGVSCHGMDPLRIAAKHPFVQVDLARINPEGLIMDDKSPDEVASELEEMHGRGVGVVGMKILGEGRITDSDRIDDSLRFVLGLGTVDAFVIGFESIEQVDDMIARTEKAIAAQAAPAR